MLFEALYIYIKLSIFKSQSITELPSSLIKFIIKEMVIFTFIYFSLFLVINLRDIPYSSTHYDVTNGTMTLLWRKFKGKKFHESNMVLFTLYAQIITYYILKLSLLTAGL